MGKILVINDSKFESRILKDMMMLLGYNVEVTCETEYLKLIDSYNPDCVVVNYILKNTDGFKIAKIIKDKNPKIKCVIQSSETDISQKLGAENIDGVFLTPIKIDLLEKVLKKIIKVK
jgi:DNA-binding NtrC family response regulator